MEEEILNLIKRYEGRVGFLNKIIASIDEIQTPSELDLRDRNSAKQSQILWKVVIKDLGKIVDK
jgi:hypothetical protein